MYGKISHNSLMMDLHGKSVKEAKVFLAEQFQRAENNDITELYIITGRGNHVNENSQRAVLKKALPRLLKPFSHQILEINPEMGSYKIFLKPRCNYSGLQSALSVFFDEEKQSNFLQHMIEKAAEGEIDALLFIASLHISGEIEGFNSLQIAIDLLEQAKQKNCLDAYALLGELYLRDGQYNKAFVHLRHAAENHHLRGQLLLGKAYALGEGIKQNDRKALYWTTLAADGGEPFAQCNLGRSYYEGDFTPQDITLAIKYLRLAAAQERSEAMVYLARCYATGDGIQQSNAEAFKFYCKAAKLKNVNGLHMVGQYIMDGRSGLPISTKDALPWFREAAELGDLDSQVKIATLLLLRAAPNIEKGMRFLNTAFAAKNRAAYHLMAYVYWLELGVEKDDVKVYDYILYAAEQNLGQAQFDLAVMLLTGINLAVEKDEARGMSWLKKSAERRYWAAAEALQKTTIPEICSILLQSKFVVKYQRTTPSPLKTNPNRLWHHEQKKEYKQIFHKLTQHLGFDTNWNLTKKDEAWCYVDSSQLASSTEALLRPFILRRAENQKDILFLNDVSKYKLANVVNTIITTLPAKGCSLSH